MALQGHCWPRCTSEQKGSHELAEPCPSFLSKLGSLSESSLVYSCHLLHSPLLFIISAPIGESIFHHLRCVSVIPASFLNTALTKNRQKSRAHYRHRINQIQPLAKVHDKKRCQKVFLCSMKTRCTASNAIKVKTLRHFKSKQIISCPRLRLFTGNGFAFIPLSVCFTEAMKTQNSSD